MTQSVEADRGARFAVENIGGIDEATVTIPPGVTVLVGENATNRTSFLQSIMAAMGSTRATIRGDADEGRVELTYRGETYERILKRRSDGTVAVDGDGLLTDPSVAELFCFLLEKNEARQAVARGDSLRDLIMEPVDIEEIKAKKRRIEARKREVDDELATIESLKGDLPGLERQRTGLRQRINEKRSELADLEAQIDENSRDVEESREEQSRLETKLGELRDLRSKLDDVRTEIDRQQESITALKRERDELTSEAAELEDGETPDPDDIDAQIDRLRNRKRERNTQASDLQSVIAFNEEMLEDADDAVMDAIGEQPETMGDITGQLLGGPDEITCWTCGSTVERATVERTLDRLREVRQEKLEAVRDIEADLDELKARKQAWDERRERRTEVETQLETVADELSTRTERIEELGAERGRLTAAVEDLEAEADELRSEGFGAVLDLHREANQLEFDIGRLESDLESLTEEIEEKEAQIAREDRLESKRSDLIDGLEELRTKIDRIEDSAVEQFNDHMEQILELLEYDNLARIWIEPVRQSSRTGRGGTAETAFELHVVRNTETGVAYEDTVDHLSESEREVTGLVFALAGYLVHDLYDDVPFMLLDSLEAIDSERIASLVDYFAQFVDHLVVALLPEDAQAQPAEYNRVTDI